MKFFLYLHSLFKFDLEVLDLILEGVDGCSVLLLFSDGVTLQTFILQIGGIQVAGGIGQLLGQCALFLFYQGQGLKKIMRNMSYLMIRKEKNDKARKLIAEVLSVHIQSHDFF